MNQKAQTVLGLETSCDETAAAIVRLDRPGGPAQILSNIVWSQFEQHEPFGGVVPEIAARAHAEKLDHAIRAAMAEAGLPWSALTGIAATAGPGLIGGVMVGLVAAKAIALARGLPLAAINHLEGHALSPRLAGGLDYPYLLLLASGGHCQFLAVEGIGRFRRLGATIDDAAGEAFDKTAKLLGLGFPGGPAVERAARLGDGARFPLPRPLVGRPGCDFSFAGLKSAVARHVERLGRLTEQDQRDIAAAFQEATLAIIEDRTRNALAMYAAAFDGPTLVAAGGVAANGPLRALLEALAAERGFTFRTPPPALCTDNAAMIALTGAERFAIGLADGLDAPARPRWPLDEAAAVAKPTHAPGRKGPKA